MKPTTMPHTINTITIIGLGKLGAPMAACFADKGFHVIGVDCDPVRVAAINDGIAPVHEPGLQEMMQRCGNRLTATIDLRDAILRSDASFIIVPTPSVGDGAFSHQHVLDACRQIGAALQYKPGFHLVTLASTVMPGTTAGVVADTLQKASGKRCGPDLGLCYSPEFIALGSVIRNFLNPDFVLIGECDDNAGDLLEAIYERVCDNDPPVQRMNPVNAELTKLAVNTFVTTKISYANMLARVCERLDGADVDVVTAALGMDSRIGGKYLKAAAAFGGPCFPRDTVAFSSLARGVGASALLADATDRINRSQTTHLAECVVSHLPDNGTATILGLAYKPDTDVIEQSPGLLLAEELVQRGVNVVAYDPLAHEAAAERLADRVTLATDMNAAVRLADVVVLTTAWPQFRSIAPDAMRRTRKRVVIDCWRLLDKGAVSHVADYVALGLGRPDEVQLHRKAAATASTDTALRCTA